MENEINLFSLPLSGGDQPFNSPSTMKLLQKDHYLFGLVVGVATPAILFGLILLINYFLLLIDVARFYLDLQTHVLTSIFGNLLPIRYYFVNLKFDKTGRGVLLITFVVVLLFFAFKDSILNLS
jgi:hypothetical protein